MKDSFSVNMFRMSGIFTDDVCDEIALSGCAYGSDRIALFGKPERRERTDADTANEEMR